MNSIPSRTTTPVAVRLPNEVYNILKRRATKQKIKPSEYLKRLVTYECLEKDKRMGVPC